MVKAKGKGAGVDKRRKEQQRKTFMEKYFAGARENKEALKYVALFLSFCVAFYLVYYFLTLRGSLSLLKDIAALILGAVFFVARAILLAIGCPPPPALIKAAFSHLEQAGGYLANFNLVAHFPMYFHGSGIAQFVVYSIGVGGVALPFVIWFVICYTK